MPWAATLLLAAGLCAAAEPRPRAPDFSFFSLRTRQIILLRDRAALRDRERMENREYGENLSAQVLNGRPVLLYFFDGRGDAGSVMDRMQELHDQYGLAGLRVVGLGLHVSSETMAAMAYRYSHLVGSSRDTEAVHSRFLNLGPLVWFLIGADGGVCAAGEAPIDWTSLAGQTKALMAGNLPHGPIAERGWPEPPARAPNFAFFAEKTRELVLLRDDAALRRGAKKRLAPSGRPLRARVLRGKPVLAYFWGPKTLPGPVSAEEPYCTDCETAMRWMQRLHERFASRGLQVVGLGLHASEEAAAVAQGYSHFIGAYGGEARRELSLAGLPSWALIDESSRVVATGQDPIDFDELSTLLADRLQQARSVP